MGGRHLLLALPKIWEVPALKVIVLRRYDELSDSSTLYTNPRDVFSMLRGVPLRAAHFYGRAAAQYFKITGLGRSPDNPIHIL